MAQVAAAEDDRLGALAARIGVDASTLSRNLRVLERAELVEITLDRKDQRKRAVWLTETGARRLAAELPLWRAAQERFGEQLGEAAQQLAGLAEGLGRS